MMLVAVMNRYRAWIDDGGMWRAAFCSYVLGSLIIVAATVALAWSPWILAATLPVIGYMGIAQLTNWGWNDE